MSRDLLNRYVPDPKFLQMPNMHINYRINLRIGRTPSCGYFDNLADLHSFSFPLIKSCIDRMTGPDGYGINKAHLLCLKYNDITVVMYIIGCNTGSIRYYITR